MRKNPPETNPYRKELAAQKEEQWTSIIGGTKKSSRGCNFKLPKKSKCIDEIRKHQKYVSRLIPKAPFAKLVKEEAYDVSCDNTKRLKSKGK